MRLALLALVLLTTLACATTENEGEAAPSSAKDNEEAQAAVPEPEQPEQPAEVAAKGGEDAGEAADPPAPPPGVKTKGNLPVMSESELAAEDAQRKLCIEKCVKAGAPEARAPEDIELDCRSECLTKIPIRQVELVPDMPPGLE